MYFKQLIPALALLCLLTMGSFATASHADKLQTIEVIAEKIEPRNVAEVNLDDYNGFESIVTREAFDNRLVDMSQIINQLPSVQTFSTGGVGGYSSASIRGSTGKQVNVYLDGILLSSAFSGYSNLGIVPAEMTEAIEVYPDFTPVQLTDGNLAGAINIRTRKLTGGDLGGKAGIGYGSFNTRQAGGSFWGGSSATQVIFAGSTLSSDNNFTVSPELFPNVSAGNSHHRENAAFEQQDIIGKMQHDINDKLLLNVMTGYSHALNDLPTMQNKIEPAATFDTENIRNIVSIESLDENLNWGTRFYNNQSNNTYKDIGQSMSLQPQYVKMLEKTLGTSLYIEYRFARQNLSASMDFSKAWIDKSNQLANDEQIDTDRDKWVTAISDVWKVNKAFSLYGIIRNYYVNDESDAAIHSFSASCSNTNQRCLDSTDQEHSEQIGASYVFAKHWTIKGNVAQLIRIPTLAEKFGEFGNYIGDPDLKPEASKTIDGGIRFNNAAIDTGLTLFNKNITDGIYVSYDSRGVGHPSNTSKANIIGAEYHINWFINDAFSYEVSGYTMDSENRSNIKAAKGKKLHGIYHYGYYTALNWLFNEHNLTASYQLDDDLYYTAANTVKAGKKESLNLIYTWQLQAWIFNVSANNLLDKQYSDFNRMPNAGRNFSTSVHYEF